MITSGLISSLLQFHLDVGEEAEDRGIPELRIGLDPPDRVQGRTGPAVKIQDDEFRSGRCEFFRQLPRIESLNQVASLPSSRPPRSWPRKKYRLRLQGQFDQ